MRRKPFAWTLAIFFSIGAGGSISRAATLTSPNITIAPGETAYIEVSGSVNGEVTNGVIIELSFTPQGGTTGTVSFTTAPPTDIIQVGDPWPTSSFTAHDTDFTGSLNANDAEISSVPLSVTFSGPLVRFPIVASPTASGVWQIETGPAATWNGVSTDITYGTITVVTESCNVNGDCNDGNSCTSDSCNGITHFCVHNPVAAGTACGDPSNTVCTNPDTCNASGVCLRNDASNGLVCNDGNVCTTGDACSSGICVGTYTANCCTNNAGCDDHNACTTDSCVANACQHANASPATACGSDVDDDCTDPDTCDGNGQCEANDVGDGGQCGGLMCQGGECGASSYAAGALPEPGYIGAEPRDGCIDPLDSGLLLVGRVIDSGQVDHAAVWTCDSNGQNCTLEVFEEGGGSVATSVACDGQGTCYTSTATITDILAAAGTLTPTLSQGERGSKTTADTAVAQGGAFPQPRAWVKTGNGPWTQETVHLPPGYTGGTMVTSTAITPEILATAGTASNAIRAATVRERLRRQPLGSQQPLAKERSSQQPLPYGRGSVSDARGSDQSGLRAQPLPYGRGSDQVAAAGTGGVFVAAGDAIRPGGAHRATYWVRTAPGTWEANLLPDFNVPGRESGAGGLVQCDGSAPMLCDANELLIAGWAEDGAGVARPVVWRETGAFSGQFTMSVPPLPNGAVGFVTDIAGSLLRSRLIAILLPSFGLPSPGHTTLVSATLEMVDGRTRGVVWSTADFSSWTSRVLPPLPGQDDSYVMGRKSGFVSSIGSDILFPGSSGPLGGNPLTDGYATQWTLDADTLALAAGPVDVNTLTQGLPAGCRFTTISFVDTISDGLRGGYTPPALRFGTTACAEFRAITHESMATQAWTMPPERALR